MGHLTATDIELFLTGRLSPSEDRRVVRHLLTNCEICNETLAPYAPAFLEMMGPLPSGPAASEDLYDEFLDRAILALRWQSSRWEQESTRREELLAKPPEALLDLCARVGPPRRDWALVEALLDVSHAMRFRHPVQMRTLAAAAVAVARELDTDWYGLARCKDLEARAWVEHANAERLSENPHSSEQALGWAVACWEDGTGDPLIMARILDVEASLRTDQRRLGEALELLDLLSATYQDLGETHLAGRALVSKGINTGCPESPKVGAQRLGVRSPRYRLSPRASDPGHVPVSCGPTRPDAPRLHTSTAGNREACCPGIPIGGRRRTAE